VALLVKMIGTGYSRHSAADNDYVERFVVVQLREARRHGPEWIRLHATHFAGISSVNE